MDDIYKRCTDPSCFDRDPSTRGLARYPPDRTELGNAGWLFLHTFAANYPNKPDDDEKLKTLAFLYSFADMYPCSVCRDGLVEIYRKAPPRVDSKKSFLLWTSRIHNLVNLDIGKPMEPFTYDQLLAMYTQDA